MINRTQREPRAVGWIAAGVVGATVLMIGAFAYTNSRTAGDTLAEAAALHAADMTLSSQDVVMKSIGQLVLLAQDEELGVAGPGDVRAAATEAERSVAAMRVWYESIDAGVSSTLDPAYAAWDLAVSDVTQLAASGDGALAATALADTLVPVSAALAGELAAERDLRAAAVEDAQSWIGMLARLAGFLAAFLIPLGAILAYRFAVRRQLRVAEAHLDTRIEAEKTVGIAKDEFIANISRELRTPLTSIYGFSETLLDQGLVDPTAAGDLVGLINNESAELTRMVEDLLVAAHGENTPLPIDQSVLRMDEQIDAAIAPFAKRGHAISGSYGPGTVVADELRVRQILRNLLSNAIEHGGPDVRVYGDIAGNNYVVAVEDNGPGVPDDTAERLFSRFVHQSDTPLTAGSVGLGLAVARLLAEAMGGSLDYERVGGRTAFIFSAPIHEPSMAVGVDVDRLIAVEQ